MNSGSNIVNSAIVQAGNKNMRTLQHPSTGNTGKLNNNNQNLKMLSTWRLIQCRYDEYCFLAVVFRFNTLLPGCESPNNQVVVILA